MKRQTTRLGRQLEVSEAKLERLTRSHKILEAQAARLADENAELYRRIDELENEAYQTRLDLSTALRERDDALRRVGSEQAAHILRVEVMQLQARLAETQAELSHALRLMKKEMP